MNAPQEGQGNNPYVNVVDDNVKGQYFILILILQTFVAL